MRVMRHVAAVCGLQGPSSLGRAAGTKAILGGYVQYRGTAAPGHQQIREG